MTNRIFLKGRLTCDPALKMTVNGNPACQTMLAVPRESDREKSDFIMLTVYGKKAQFLCQYFKKGQPIEVTGELQTERYTDQKGISRTALRVYVKELDFIFGVKKEQTQGADDTQTPPDDGDLPF